MSYSFYWTPQAEETFAANLDYLYKSWPTVVMIDFLDRVEEVLQKLRENPHLYAIHRELGGIRKCIINERIILFYEIDGDAIHLLTFWNTHQDSQNLFL